MHYSSTSSEKNSDTNTFMFLVLQRQGFEKLNMNLLKFGQDVSLGYIKLCVKLLCTQNIKSGHLIIFF